MYQYNKSGLSRQILKISILGANEMAQELKALATFSKDIGLIPRVQMVSQNHL